MATWKGPFPQGIPSPGSKRQLVSPTIAYTCTSECTTMETALLRRERMCKQLNHKGSSSAEARLGGQAQASHKAWVGGWVGYMNLKR